MIYEVEMWAFDNLGEIREVDVPVAEVETCKDIEEELELVFRYGQNDFQTKPIRSVSVDDVIRINVGGNTQLWAVVGCGFVNLENHSFYHDHVQATLRRYKIFAGVSR